MLAEPKAAAFLRREGVTGLEDRVEDLAQRTNAENMRFPCDW